MNRLVVPFIVIIASYYLMYRSWKNIRSNKKSADCNTCKKCVGIEK